MKTKLILLLTIVLFSINVNAQRKSPEEIAKIQTERISEKILLLDEQKEQIYEINLKYIKDSSLDKANKNNEIKAILSDKQKAEFDKIATAPKEKKENPQGRKRPKQ